MRKVTLLLAALAAIGLAGCFDHNATAPHLPPAAPGGVFSVTGDQGVTLHWVPSTQAGIVGYNVYQSTCATTCPYTRIGASVVDSFVVTGLTNGVTRFFAVTAVDAQGSESPLSYETVYDTPRPAGTNGVIVNMRGGAGGTGWDFSAMAALPWANPQVDVVYSDTLGFAEVYAADVNTDIQDAGYASTLDAVDFAPASGWSPSGSVEAIVGHNYVVWTRDNHYAKFRVTSVSSGQVVFDWAYQTAAGNGELRLKHAGHGAANARQALVTQR